MTSKFFALIDERIVTSGPMVKVFDITVPSRQVWTPTVVILERIPGQPSSQVQGEAYCTPGTPGNTITVAIDKFTMGSSIIRRSTAMTTFGEGDRFTFFLQTAEPIKVRSYIPILIDVAVDRYVP
jgi:hypothetical protein